MPLYELKWNWFYVTIVSIVALFIIGMTSDMIGHWEDKKISDARALILGTGIFGLILLLFTVDFKITILFGLILANTILAGLMAVDDRFTTSDKPWELYVMLSLSVTILIGSLVYFYYNTSIGKALQRQQDKFANYVKKPRSVKKAPEDGEAKQVKQDERINPSFTVSRQQQKTETQPQQRTFSLSRSQRSRSK